VHTIKNCNYHIQKTSTSSVIVHKQHVAMPTASNVEAEKVVDVTPSGQIPNIAASKIVIKEDLILIDIIRSKDMAVTGYIEDIFTQEIEISYIVVSALHEKQVQV